MAKALFRPLTKEIVQEGLDRLYNNVSPGDDGVGAQVYKVFQDLFVPRMMELARGAFESGSLPEGWEIGLTSCIPKSAGAATINRVRPMALQNVKKKLLMNILCVQVEQLLQQLTHKR